jgi:hypothetical protein
MQRLQFMTLLGGSALAWLLAARGQQPAMPVIGFLGGTSPEVYANRVRAFRQGLKEAGDIDGQNVEIEYLWAEGHNDRLPNLAAEPLPARIAALCRQLLQQRLRLFKIARVEAFSEPAVSRSELFARLLRLTLVAPEAREGVCRVQLRAFSGLRCGNLDSHSQACLRRVDFAECLE